MLMYAVCLLICLIYTHLYPLPFFTPFPFWFSFLVCCHLQSFSCSSKKMAKRNVVLLFFTKDFVMKTHQNHNDDRD